MDHNDRVWSSLTGFAITPVQMPSWPCGGAIALRPTVSKSLSAIFTNRCVVGQAICDFTQWPPAPAAMTVIGGASCTEIGRYRGMEVRPKAVPGDFNRHCVGGGGAGNLPAGATYGRRKCALIFLIKELRELEYSLHRQGFSNCLKSCDDLSQCDDPLVRVRWWPLDRRGGVWALHSLGYDTR